MKSVFKVPLSFLAMAASGLMAAPLAVAEEPSLNIGLRTLYFNRDLHEGGSNRVAASQAVRVDYVSPYFNDMIGFDASVFGALKLDGRGDDQTLNMLHAHNGETESYAKLGQAYLKLKLGSNTELRAGRMVLATPLLYDDDARSTPSSTQAIKLDTQLGGASLYAIYSDRAANMADTKFDRYKASGEDYGLYVLGGSYAFDSGLNIQLAHGVAEDYVRQSYVNLSYPIQLGNGDSMLLDAHYYDASEEGDLFTNADTGANEYDSSLFNLAGRYIAGNLTMTVSYQQVGGDHSYQYSWDGFNKDNHILMVWNSVQYLDFNSQDEQSLQLRADYQVAAVPGLSLMVRHTEGWDIDSGVDDDLEEQETDLEAKYVFQSGGLEGLSLRLRVAHVESDQFSDVDEVRLIANYGFNVF